MSKIKKYENMKPSNNLDCKECNCLDYCKNNKAEGFQIWRQVMKKNPEKENQMEHPCIISKIDNLPDVLNSII